MDYTTIYYPESRFGGFTDIDGTIAFYVRVNSLVTPSSVVLDVGCGSGAYSQDPVRIRREFRILRGKCKKVIGIDIDQNAGENPFLDEFRLIEGDQWPIQAASVDVCVCDNVLEHIQDPEQFFSMCRRVIKRGGYLCIRTPNLLSYIGLLSKLMPTRLRSAVLNKAQPMRQNGVYPAFYRSNTKKRLRHMLDKYGFDHWVYGYEAEPRYVSFSRLLYLTAVIYQRLAPGAIKSVIFCFARRI